MKNMAEFLIGMKLCCFDVVLFFVFSVWELPESEAWDGQLNN